MAEAEVIIASLKFVDVELAASERAQRTMKVCPEVIIEGLELYEQLIRIRSVKASSIPR